MSKIFVTTDTHFGHQKLIDNCDRTKNDVDSFIDHLSLLKESDLLIHLGDVALSDEAVFNKTIGSLSCKKVLVMGNHDNHSIFWYMDKGWDFACERFHFRRYSYDLVFTHCPLKMHNKGRINICGHMHFDKITFTSRIVLPPLRLYDLDCLMEEYNKVNCRVEQSGSLPAP